MRILHVVAGVVITLVVLAGCAPTPPPVTLPPALVETPLFASEEEALAAAVEVYGAYLAAIDVMGQGGWRDTSGLAAVATGELLELELDAATTSSAQGLVQTGNAMFTASALQQYSSVRPVLISFYGCLDVSGIDIRDSSGSSVVAEDRADVVSLEIDVAESQEGVLKVSRSEPWSGSDFC